jgi:hypothetical protein
VVAVVLAAIAQLALPRLAADRAEERLTRDGGSADVEVDALPAVRLLFKDGDRLRVRAREIELPLLDLDADVLGDLDGFDEVDIAVSDATAGPLELESVTLVRGAGAVAYRTAIRGSVDALGAATFLGGPLAGLAASAMPFGDEPVPVELDATIRSDDGRPRAVVVHGSIAGVPAGPLVEALALAIARGF